MDCGPLLSHASRVALLMWNYTDRSVSLMPKKEALHLLRSLDELHGGLTGDVGGVRRPVDHSGHDGPLHEQGDGRGQRRSALTGGLLDDAPQQDGEPPLVVPDELRPGMG